MRCWALWNIGVWDAASAHPVFTNGVRSVLRVSVGEVVHWKESTENSLRRTLRS